MWWVRTGIRETFPGSAERSVELGTQSFGLSWEPCRQRGEERCGFTSLTGVTAMKVNEIWCLQQERSKGGCVVTGMLVSPGWECCASQSMWEEQELSWSRCRDGEGPGLSRCLAWEIKSGVRRTICLPLHQTGAVGWLLLNAQQGEECLCCRALVVLGADPSCFSPVT